MKLRSLVHLFRISSVLVRYGLDEVVLQPEDLPHSDWLIQQAYLTGSEPKYRVRLFRPLRWVWWFSPWYWRRDLSQPLAVRVRLALESLGPLFVKFGQMLSTRPDILPDELVGQLSLLQDNVPPFCGELAETVVAQALGQPLHEVFSSFDRTPLASASIAQVHSAELKNGERVVVKVLRPKILKIIQRDLALMRWLAHGIQKVFRGSHQFQPLAVVNEYEKIILNELDLLREAANAAQLKRNFEGSDLLYVPKIHWDYCRPHVMVLEYIDGIAVTDIAALKKHGIPLKDLAERGVEIFFSQVFRDNFFHADMHPGNVFVQRHHTSPPQYVAIDFGIMGSLNASDKRYIAENLLAFFKRDYQKIAELHVQSGWVDKSTSVEDFSATIRTVCEPIFQKPLNEISFGKLMVKLLQTAAQYNMRVQPQLMLLQKTLLQVEGLGRQLYPELNLWTTALPFLEKWGRQQANPLKLIEYAKDKLPFMAEYLPQMPELFLDMLTQHQHRQSQMAEQLVVSQKNHQALQRVFWVMAIGVSTGLAGVFWVVWIFVV